MSSSITPSLIAADLFSVDRLVAVVTGGATGIGLMIVKALEENGAKVYIIGRRKEVLDKVAKEEAKHGNIIPLQGDASSKPDLERIVAHITKETGYINLLVANAGISGPDPVRITPSTTLSELQRDLWSLDPSIFAQTFSVNVGTAYFSIAAFLPLLDAGNHKGNVVQSSQAIITSSIGAFGRVPLAHYAYSASKAAVTHMTKQFATALTKYKIRFNILAPGLYPSEMTAGIVKSFEQLSPEERATRVSPLGREGNTEDMAGCILWLASKAGAWLSGNVVVSDGGKLSVTPSSY
uniref:Short-chain dehydrogenase/reductase PhomF' n=1 Tax=Diaporthe leptostromiformis TaxID=291059 RepID=PHOF2_DIALO|nr:RecName: Full=Short-chain dehydrogenase/reductase PhomF'; AltName: Full=Phomopsin biosynthesis cluster protein F' [Diaporthe leptostromiformis]AMR44278.1 putative short chain dehydrogenase reductase [Diaporthe leptostromiformis]